MVEELADRGPGKVEALMSFDHLHEDLAAGDGLFAFNVGPEAGVAGVG
ncbi:hypothetical protein ACFQ6E_33800 [Streptomyces sp. NPDC056462]